MAAHVKRLLADIVANADPIPRVIDLARRHLGMDVVYISRFDEGSQVPQVIQGDAASFGLAVGAGIALESTYCQRMLVGSLPSLVTNARADNRVEDLPATRERDIGAYVGIPLVLSDGALYGGFCCLSHDPHTELDDRDVQFMRLLAELIVGALEGERDRAADRHTVKRIIDDAAFAIALQPIIGLADGRCVGFEALSRFHPPAGTPDVVFEAAERSGLLMDLEVATAAMAIEAFAVLPPSQYLSLNVSPEMARENSKAAMINDLPWHQLVAEITEREYVTDYAELSRELQPLRERGLRVAIDDAGAGYASLHHIVQLTPDIIKIDRSLVHGITDDPALRSIISGFITLARDLGATLVAEGVEDPRDLELLARFGVDAAQGFLLGRPSVNYAELVEASREPLDLASYMKPE